MWKLCVPGSFDRQARAGTSSARESQGMLYQGHLDGTAGAWADVGRGPRVHGTRATMGRAVSWSWYGLGAQGILR